MSVMEWVKRTTLANVTAVIVALVGLWYGVTYQDEKTLGFIIGAGVTWLFDQKNSSSET